MTGAGKALMGIGRGFGPTRAVDAAMAAASARVDEYYLGDDGALPPEARSLWRREPRG